MSQKMMYNRYRPKLFADVVGQESELKVIFSILEKGWKPSAMMLSGGYGTGKTTLARLISRALLCDSRNGVEPCGTCDSCLAMDSDSNPAYLEIDSASNGLVEDIRSLKDEASYRSLGGKPRIIVLDESHMISVPGQNAMLQILEEGKDGVLFMFATTDPEKMLPTLRSRCVELSLKLLTSAEIYERLKIVAEAEGGAFEEKALRIIATYVRGHMRDALVLLEQIIRMSGVVTEDLVRAHLRLDRLVELYELLCEKDRAGVLRRLEALLCQHSPGDLADGLGQVMLNSFKQTLGVGDFTQVDLAWMKKVVEAQGAGVLLEKAERLLSLNADFASIQYGLTAFMRILDPVDAVSAPSRSPVPGASMNQAFRKGGVVRG